MHPTLVGQGPGRPQPDRRGHHRCSGTLAMILAAGAGLSGLLGGADAWAGDRALLVGIDDYQMDGLDLPPDSSTLDARNMKALAIDHLGYPPEGVKLLLNEDASYDGILKAIDDWLIAGTKPGDRVMFTYSGHGYYVDDEDGDEEDGRDEVLVPWDAGQGASGDFINLLPDDELHERFARLTDRESLVLIDSCHSGTVTRSLNPATQRATRNAPALRRASMTTSGTRSMMGGATRGDANLPPDANAGSFVPIASMTSARVFTAAAASEVAWVDVRAVPEQGVFTSRLIKAVAEGAADSNGNGIISNAEVLMYLRGESEAFCGTNPDCESLTPTLETSEDLIARDFRTGERAASTSSGAVDGLGKPTANLALRIEPGTQVRLGDTVTFAAESSIDGYLVVLDINAAEEVTQLFPNRFTGGSNRVSRGQTIRIPDRQYGFVFEAVPPVGEGVVVAVISSEPVAPEALLAHRDLATISDPQSYLDRLGVAMVDAWSTREQGKPVEWGYVTARYSIAP